MTEPNIPALIKHLASCEELCKRARELVNVQGLTIAWPVIGELLDDATTDLERALTTLPDEAWELIDSGNPDTPPTGTVPR